MVVVVHPDGSHQRGMVDVVVVGKFCQQYQFDPAVLLVVATSSAVPLDCFVLPLSVTVHLRAACCVETVIDMEVGANYVLKSTGKLFAGIGGDIGGYTTFADHVFEKPLC